MVVGLDRQNYSLRLNPPDILSARHGVLDGVVSVEGAVTHLKVINEPGALSRAAIDAVRWWRYEPYVVNAERATVETMISVNFGLPNWLRAPSVSA